MKILGIDPGTAIVGFGIIEHDEKGINTMIDCGAITTKSGLPMPDRLQVIYEDLTEIIQQHKPAHIAIEELFFVTNQKTAITVAQARGVILLAARQSNAHIGEYTPLQIKQAITGYGRADKKQIQEMVRKLLRMDYIVKPDDAADGLAIALTHANGLRYSGLI